MTTPDPDREAPAPTAENTVDQTRQVVVDRALRVAGALVAVAAAALTGILELLLSTVRIGGQLIGLSAAVAVVGNALIAWFAIRAVGHVWAVALPAAVWFLLMVAAVTRTSEGDLLLTGDNWVGLLMIFGGSLSFAVVAFRAILSPSRMDRAGRRW